jgi:hypothetical protein
MDSIMLSKKWKMNLISNWQVVLVHQNMSYLNSVHKSHKVQSFIGKMNKNLQVNLNLVHNMIIEQYAFVHVGWE